MSFKRRVASRLQAVQGANVFTRLAPARKGVSVPSPTAVGMYVHPQSTSTEVEMTLMRVSEAIERTPAKVAAIDELDEHSVFPHRGGARCRVEPPRTTTLPTIEKNGCSEHHDCFTCPFEDCLYDQTPERRAQLIGAVRTRPGRTQPLL